MGIKRKADVHAWSGAGNPGVVVEGGCRFFLKDITLACFEAI